MPESEKKERVIRNHYIKAVTGLKELVSQSGKARDSFSFRLRNEPNAPFYRIIVERQSFWGGSP